MRSQRCIEAAGCASIQSLSSEVQCAGRVESGQSRRTVGSNRNGGVTAANFITWRWMES